MAEFSGKVALVTGGGSGIGEAIAKSLAARNAAVVVSDVNREAAERVVQEITAFRDMANAINQDTASRTYAANFDAPRSPAPERDAHCEGSEPASEPPSRSFENATDKSTPRTGGQAPIQMKPALRGIPGSFANASPAVFSED